MEPRPPSKYDFDGEKSFKHKQVNNIEPFSGDVLVPRPVRITHFMQPMCSTYGMPTRKMLIQMQEERPLNTFIEFRESVMRKPAKIEAEGKSVVGGWSQGVDRDLKDETFDLHGSADEMLETGFEIICPFTKVEMFENGQLKSVLRLVGSDAKNQFALYETLLRMKMDEYSNVENAERMFNLMVEYQDELEDLAAALDKREKKLGKL